MKVVKRLLLDSGIKFVKMYFYIGACVKKSFLVGYRIVTMLDKCFLKGLCKGEVLGTIVRDENN